MSSASSAAGSSESSKHEAGRHCRGVAAASSNAWQMRLPTGAELRITGPADATLGVLCLNGGQAGEVEGTWSATLEWLVQRLAGRFPALSFGEVRYRIKSWRRLDWCIEDAAAAIDAVGAPRTLVIGFSMGGAVATQVAAHPSVEAMLGLAPWFP